MESGGEFGFERIDFELGAVLGVLVPGAEELEGFSALDVGEGAADDGCFFCFIIAKFADAEMVFFVKVDDAFEDADEFLEVFHLEGYFGEVEVEETVAEVEEVVEDLSGFVDVVKEVFFGVGAGGDGVDGHADGVGGINIKSRIADEGSAFWAGVNDFEGVFGEGFFGLFEEGVTMVGANDVEEMVVDFEGFADGCGVGSGFIGEEGDGVVVIEEVVEEPVDAWEENEVLVDDAFIVFFE